MTFSAQADPRATLSTAEREELYLLLCRHFEGVERDLFARDLNEKDWVLRIRHEGKLVGFTTLQVFVTEFAGSRLNILYSGDTITDPEVWGSSVLARSWIALVRQIQGDRVSEPWYWLLLSSGFRTYRLLPVFFREFWPRHDAETPPAAASLLTHLASERFGPLFDAQGGIVRFERPQRLREALAEIPAGKLRDPHVAFFLERNPQHTAGDELVCLADLGDGNLTTTGLRMRRGRIP